MTDRIDIADKMAQHEGKSLGFFKAHAPGYSAIYSQRNIGVRTDDYLHFINGGEHGTAPLSAPAIYYGTPALTRSADGRAIAGLLADTHSIEDLPMRRDAQRRILAVAAGDVTQIKRLEEETPQVASIADALKNMKRGTVGELKIQALVPDAKFNPAFISDLERQLDNQNADESLSDFVTHMDKRNTLTMSVRDTLDELPGVSSAGRRGAARAEGKGLARSGEIVTGAPTLDKGANAVYGVFQRSLNHVPVAIVKPLDIAASPWTKAPTKVSDALRQVHFQGVVNLHDWNGASLQLDSMMRLAGVEHGTRLKTLSDVYLAQTEPEKTRLIAQAEDHAMRAIWTKAVERGQDVNDMDHREFFEELMEKRRGTKRKTIAQLRGRTYAATQMPDNMLAKSGLDDSRWKPRVDMIDDHGTPLSLPLLETQLANKIPLLDIATADKIMRRETTRLQRHATAWKNEITELGHLKRLKAKGGTTLDAAINTRRAAADITIDATQRMMRAWKIGVLLRLGYPLRIHMDDHMRIWTHLNAMSFYGSNAAEGGRNFLYNQVGRRAEAAQFMQEARVQRRELLDQLESNHPDVYASRKSDIVRTNRQIVGHQNAISKWQKRIDEAQAKHSLGIDHGEDLPTLHANIRDAKDLIREKQGAVDYLSEQLGDDPEQIKRGIAALEEKLQLGHKAFTAEKHGLGQKDVVLPGGYTASGAYAGPYGKAWLESTNSTATFEAQIEGAEERVHQSVARGAYRTIAPTEPGHAAAWADVANHQFAMSKAARHFLKGGSVDEFASKVTHDPEWADLRERLPHFAHDPEDWGHRIQALVRDYLPTDALRQAALEGKARPRDLARAIPNLSDRPAVHGTLVADNLGTSASALMAGKALNRVYRFLGEMPTDKLSRHPFFASMYKQHLQQLHGEKMAMFKAKGLEYNQAEVTKLEQVARKRALHDIKRTLFDISAHTHAAHVLRFISPFFAAHQEGLSRWWRIAVDDPSVVRRFQLAFDMPRKVGLVYDSTTGEPVKPGDSISSNHRILLRVPAAWGGKNASPKWSINENSFNLVLQGGLMNPGVGPLVSMPVEGVAKKYAEDPEIAKVARVLNPYPPDTWYDPLVPASLQRVVAYTRKEGDPEYARQFSSNAMDAMVSFEDAHGRPPTKDEAERIMVRAGRQTNVDSFLRILWNAASPSPARPESKYSAIQNGWYRISTQARTQGKDFAWARDRFVEKYGDIYLPLIYSSSNNPGNITMSTESVGQVKRNRALLRTIDPALTRMVLGADGEGEYSPEARSWFKSARMQPGDTATYLSDDTPKTMLVDQVVRQGWAKYSALTGALTAAAQDAGLNAYQQSKYLVEMKRQALSQLAEQNPMWWHDYSDFNDQDYEQYIGDMRQIANNPKLAGDTGRQDVQVLKGYLELRDMVMGELARRKQAGLPFSPDAKANAGLMSMYSNVVGQLVEKSPDFEKYMFNGTIDRDPLLRAGDLAVAMSGGSNG
jgi:hypothetical protein